MNEYLIIDLANKVEWQVFEEFKVCDLRQNGIKIKYHPELLARILLYYPFFRKVDDWIIYDKIENYGDKTFKIGDLELEYYRGWRGNREASNNRASEIALVKWFADKYNNNIIEVGDVGAGYEFFKGWDTLDPFGPYEKAIRKDVLDYDYTNCNLVSVSTWEHFSEGAYNNNDKDKPIKALQKVSKEAKNWLITFDVGADRYFEDWLMNQDEFKYTFLVRDNVRGLTNNWHQSNEKNNFYLPYLHHDYLAGYYGNAAAIVILSNQKEIL